jgi:hypothetical protein
MKMDERRMNFILVGFRNGQMLIQSYLYEMNQKPPFDFIFDHLLPMTTNVKPFFGMFSVYSGEKLLLILRERDDQPEMNGIWIAVNNDGSASLKKDLPVLRAFPGPKSGKKEGGWLVIPAKADDFERAAIKVCDLIVHRDPRIGKIPRPRSRRPPPA